MNSQLQQVQSRYFLICTMKYFSFYYLVPIHNEAVEIEANVAIPADGAQHIIVPRIHSKGVYMSKSRNLVRHNGESSDEHIA
jgi:hypothetical protein